MTTRRTLLIILALAFLGAVLTSCATGRSNSSSCGYPAEMTVGNSTRNIPTGNCAGDFLSSGANVHVEVGQTLTVHLADAAGSGSSGTAAARSQNPKVLELTSAQPLEERYQAVAPGVTDILFSPPIDIPGTCWSGYGYQHPNIAEPCVVAKVTVTQSCAGKSSGKCSSPQSNGAAGSNETPPQISPSLAALKAKQSPLAVMCKQRFFTDSQLQLLVQQFGFIECFRFTGEDQWIIIGNGRSMQTNPPFPGSTRGGPVVAMEKCANSDWSCLDPSAVHNFANFTVYYSPGPTTDMLGILDGTA